MKWWDGLPEWLRWVLYVPAVILTSGAMAFLIALVMGSALGSSKLGVVLSRTFQTGIGTGTAMYLAHGLAPRGKRIALGIWMVLASITIMAGIGGFFLLRAFGHAREFKDFVDFLAALAGGAALIIVWKNLDEFK